MTEVVATRRYQFKLLLRGNAGSIAKRINRRLADTVHKSACEASAFVDPKNPSTVIVEMKCATGSDIYLVDRDTIYAIIKESEKDKIEHIIGPLELQV